MNIAALQCVRIVLIRKSHLRIYSAAKARVCFHSSANDSGANTPNQSVTTQENDSADVFGNLAESHWRERNSEAWERRKSSKYSSPRKNEPGNKTATKSANDTKLTNATKFQKLKSLPRDAADEFGTLVERSADSIPLTGQAISRSNLLARERASLSLRKQAFERETEDEMWLGTGGDANDIGVESRPIGFRHSPQWYYDKCKELGAHKKVAECVAMLEQRMLKEDRVRPNNANFNVVIGVLAQHGYTKKAFELAEQLEKHDLRATLATYTSLFNACANCPYAELGLERARRLKSDLKERSVILTRIPYQAMMKAFARLGDLATAFAIVDEMMADGIRPDVSTYSHLLSACISDKNSGFKLAIEVWRRMIRRQIKPDVTAWSLLLRACKECGLGNESFANELLRRDKTPPPLRRRLNEEELLDRIMSLVGDHVPTLPSPAPEEALTANSALMDDFLQSELPPNTSSETDSQSGICGQLSLRSGGSSEDVPVITSEVTAEKSDLEIVFENQNEPTLSEEHFMPDSDNFNLTASDLANSSDSRTLTERICSLLQSNALRLQILNPKFQAPEELISLASMQTPEQRLALLGGVDGVLRLMAAHKLTPNVKVFTQLLDLVPGNIPSEVRLLEQMELAGVKPDEEFLHQLINRRTLRLERDAAKEVLHYFRKYKLMPGQRTLGFLAFTCGNRADAVSLVEDAKNLGLQPGLYVYYGLMRCGVRIVDYHLVSDVLQHMEKHKVWPDARFLKFLEAKSDGHRRNFINAERKLTAKNENTKFYHSDYSQNGFARFSKLYPDWLKRCGVTVPKHPWAELERHVPRTDLLEDWERERQTG